MKPFLATLLVVAVAAGPSIRAADNVPTPSPEAPARGSAAARQAPAEELVPEDEFGRGVPRSAVENLWKALARGDYARATNYLKALEGTLEFPPVGSPQDKSRSPT